MQKSTILTIFCNPKSRDWVGRRQSLQSLVMAAVRNFTCKIAANLM